ARRERARPGPPAPHEASHRSRRRTARRESGVSRISARSRSFHLTHTRKKRFWGSGFCNPGSGSGFQVLGSRFQGPGPVSRFRLGSGSTHAPGSSGENDGLYSELLHAVVGLPPPHSLGKGHPSGQENPYTFLNGDVRKRRAASFGDNDIAQVQMVRRHV